MVLAAAGVFAAPVWAQPPAPASNGGQASVVIVEVVGYGGGAAGDGNGPPDPQDPRDRRSQLPDGGGSRYDHASTVQFLGVGELSDDEKSMLTAAEQKNLKGQAR